MALTTVEYTYSGQASFVIPFSLGILNRAYVTIQINNQVDGSGDPLYYTNFTWTSDSEVVINGLTNGDIIKIARAIPSNVLLSDYTAGSNITRDNLNIANKQLIMLIHEVLDKNGTQQTKLDTIEPNAKDDQTPAEIKTAYESIANTNAFTDADESKLDGIESGADVTDTANVTAAGAVMDSEVTDLPGIKAVTVSTLQVKPSEGAFVDGDKTKLNTIESNADVTDTANVVAALTAGTNITIASDGTIASTATGGGGGVSDIVDDLTPELGGDLDLNGQDITGTGNIAITGTVNTRDMAADGTKLDAIEALADVTDTDNVVAALTAGTNVTIAADGTISSTDTNTNTTYTIGDGGLTTNDFTNADHSKLDAIEAGATADQTKADIDALNIDADTLDGQHGSYYTSYADTAVAGIVDSAPGTLDTLNELAQALGDDPNFATTTATNLSLKLPKAGGTMTGNILFNDGVKAKFGASNDLQIWHNGTDSYVYDTGEGDLILRGSSNIKLQSAGGTALSTFTAAGASTLYYSAAEKLATTSSGIDVTGNVDISGAGTRRIDISNTTLADTGEMATLQWDNNANFTIQGRTSAGGFAANWYSIQTSDTDGRADAHIFYTDASAERMRINSTGIGIGTTSPNHELHIESTSPTIRLVDSDGNNTVDISQSGSATYIDFDNNVRFRNLADVQRFRIDTSGAQVTGDLLVQDASPVIALKDTNGDTTTSTPYVLYQSSNGTQLGYIGYGSSGNGQLNIVNSNSDDITFFTANTQRLAVQSTGIAVTGDIDVTGGIDVANGTTYTTTGDFLAKVQQNSNTSGANGLSVMNAWASSNSTIFEAAMGWNGSAAGYYPVFKIDGLGKTTWTDNAGNVRATIDGSGLDVNGSIDTVGASNTRQWSVGTAGAKMGVYALDNSTMYMRVESGA